MIIREGYREINAVLSDMIDAAYIKGGDVYTQLVRAQKCLKESAITIHRILIEECIKGEAK